MTGVTFSGGDPLYCSNRETVGELIYEIHEKLPEKTIWLYTGSLFEQIKALPENILGLPRTNSMTELAQWYTAADVFVCPSYEETFGMTAMEARACGTEAIVYQDTACEEIVNQFGGIAVPQGAKYLLEAIEKRTKEEQL